MNVFGEVTKFFFQFPPLQLTKDELLLSAGFDPRYVYYLKYGLVREFFLSQAGGIFLHHIYKPDSFFPLVHLFHSGPSEHFFETITPALVYKAPLSETRSFFLAQPYLMTEAAQRLSRSVNTLSSRLENLALGNAVTKIASLLLYLGKNFGEATTGGILVRIPLTHREIAAWTGTTRETVTIQMHKLNRQHIIHCQGHQLLIRDLPSLESLACC